MLQYFGIIKVWLITVWYLICGIFLGAGYDSELRYKYALKNIPEYTNTLKTAKNQTELRGYIINHYKSELSKGKTVKKAIVIGYDGCRADTLQHLHDGHPSAINSVLSEKDGNAFITYAGGVNYPYENTQRTSTATGWCSMVTGVLADKHGVTDSDILMNPEYSTVMRTLVEEKTINKSSFYVSWNGHFTNEDSTYYGEKTYCEKEGINSYYLDADSDTETKENVINDIKQEDCSDFIFAILEDPDHSGHDDVFSPYNQNYVDGFYRSELNALEIINEIKSRKTYDTEDWLIIITSDHGGSCFGHGSSPIMERMTFIVSNKVLY